MKKKLLSILLTLCILLMLAPTAVLADESASVQVGSTNANQE